MNAASRVRQRRREVRHRREAIDRRRFLAGALASAVSARLPAWAKSPKGYGIGSVVPPSAIKWYPGTPVMTANGNSSTPGEQTEISCYEAAQSANAGLSAISNEYQIWRYYNDFYPSVWGAGTYASGATAWHGSSYYKNSSGSSTTATPPSAPWVAITPAQAFNPAKVITTYNNLQAAIPGCRLACAINSYANYSNAAFSANAGINYILPPHVYYGGSTYGNAPPAGSGNGWALVGWGGAGYAFCIARWDNNNVMADILATRLLLANYVMPSGLTWDLDPLCSLITDAIPSGNSGGYQSGNPKEPTDYSPANLLANWQNQGSILIAGAPHTLFSIQPDSEWSGGSVANTTSVVAGMAAVGGGFGFSCNDCTTEPSTNAIDPSDAQHADIGDTYNTGTSSWSTGGSTDYRGVMLQAMTIQTPDWDRGASKNTQAQALLCIQGAGYNTYKSHYVYCSMASKISYNVNADYFNSTGSNQTDSGGRTVTPGSNGFILNAQLAAGVNPNSTRPSNI